MLPIKKSDARRRGKGWIKKQWEKEMEQYNIQKAQFEKRIKRKERKGIKKINFQNHITLYFMTYDLFLHSIVS